MFRIVWKSFRKNMKNFLAFFTSTIVTICVLFLMMYVQESLENVIRTGIFVNQLSGDLEVLMKILSSTLIIVGVVVIAYSVQFYIYSRMKDYGMLKILGIKRKDMNRMLVLEYGIGCICSCAIGIGAGQVISFGIGKLFESLLGVSFIEKIEMTNVYKYTIIICVLMILLSVIVISIILSERELSVILKGTVVKERRIVTSKALIFFALGLVIMIASMILVFRCENLYIQNYLLLLFYVGFGIAFIFGTGYLFEKYRKSQRYFQKILVWNDLYHYFNSNKYMVLIQTLIGVIVIYFSSFFLAGIMGNGGEAYPNDILCIYQEGSTLKESIQESWETEGISFPFIEVNPDFCEGRIGISESCYRQNFGKSDGLTESEIISICDTESMQSLREEETTEKSKKIYFENMEEGENYIIKSERIENRLGFGFGGMVIFSDTVFEKIRQDTGEQKEMLLLNVEESKLDDMTVWLEKQPKNMTETIFSKQTEKENRKRDNTLAVVVLVLVDVTILFFGMFIQWLKTFSDSKRLQDKYLFLKTAGMKEKELKKTLKSEIGIPIGIEIICAILIGGMFAGKNLYGEWKLFLLLIVGYFLLQYLFLQSMRSWVLKRTEEQIS